MACLAKKWLVFLIFCFITVGQAYPFATAYTLSHEHAECTCSKSGRSCIHGCDLRHRKNSQKAFSAHDHDHSHEDHDHNHHNHGAHVESKKILSQDSLAQFVSPACSKQHERKILSFQGDPCLLNKVEWISTAVISYEISRRPSFHEDVLLACDERPPKDKDHSSDH